MYEAMFEYYGFKSVFNCPSQMLTLVDYQANHPEIKANPCAIVVDSGYSFTHIVPFFDNTKLNYAIKRINVGGKLLTNYLKEIISYRQWNMTEETHLMNIIKERLCYVPLNFLGDLKIAQRSNNSIMRHYVLPDNITNTVGYIKGIDKAPPVSPHMMGAEEKVLIMNTERLIPEILFHPSDIGRDQAGIAEAIIQSVSSTSEELHELFYSNIILMGGNTLFPGFKQRLEQDLRKLVPVEYEINVRLPKDPILSAYRGGCKFALHPDYMQYVVTKEQYNEHGSLEDRFLLCKSRFNAV